ncbi:MAG: tRNA 2-thiouridine(34) synthase MnmA [Actinomycetia bacterium]|nr:tRNA 2-thiouridine(34) synthase MnmA [Actinomycetes bacterium]
MQELTGDASEGEDWAWIRLGVEDQLIRQATGGGPGAAELCRSLEGLSLLEAAACGGAPLMLDALHVALGPAVAADSSPDRLVVAMSGGVDSAVALHHGRDAGHAPIGVTLRLWVDPAAPDHDRACCSPRAARAARALCHSLAIPHVTLDLRERFRKRIVAPFIDGYARGETPNPCVRCNGLFRFDELAQFASRLGAARLATGHYARIVRRNGRLLVARAHDVERDQSYMLARLPPWVLSLLWFPLGEQTKGETRAQARALGLEAAERRSSQEACFLGGSDYRDFLARHGLKPADGPVLDADGRELGRHGGFWRFTAGQRRGLALGGTRMPLYVVETDASTNTLTVGPRTALGRTRVRVDPGELYAPVERADVALRYGSPAVASRILPEVGGFSVELDEPVFGVARGQVAVVYEEDAVVGAGLISDAR